MNIQVLSLYLIFSLKDSKDFLFFTILGTIYQILGARYDIVSVPHFAVLALLLRNVLQDITLFVDITNYNWR